MPKDRVWILLARKFCNEATDQESIELHDLLKDDDEMQSLATVLELFWKSNDDSETKNTQLIGF